MPPAKSIEIIPSLPALPAVELDPRRQARALYWQGWRIPAISTYLGLSDNTLYAWERRDKWREAMPLDRMESAVEARFVQLVLKPEKTGTDFKEIDLLGRQMSNMARIARYSGGGTEADLNPNIRARNESTKRKPTRNHFSPEQIERLTEAFTDSLFGYQKIWLAAGVKNRIRNLLKSRQIGATWYFAREALMDAIQTGRNQIFLSASKAQAHQFRAYILEFAKNEADVDLTGDPIVLSNDASLIFLGTNSRTAQSYHGNLYLDEYFWIPRFQTLRKVASGMASQKKWRQTYFSTPSAKCHEAFPFWTGELFNKGRPSGEHIHLDVGHAALRKGRACEDGQWRQIVTLLDAQASGCDLFDADQLRREYSPDEFRQLFLCEFMDDGASVFSFNALQACMVDAWVEWEDYKPFAAKPLGQRPVWLGYDPASTGDSAALVVVAPPQVAGAPFRVLERHQFKGLDFAAQADQIRKMCNRYRVEKITIDKTGMGDAVHQLVTGFRPDAQGLTYSLESKTRLVLKALDVVTKGRLAFDAGWTEMVASFLSIKRVLTGSGQRSTFAAGRSEETSHADLAWAVMHTLINEPLEGETGARAGVMEMYG